MSRIRIIGGAWRSRLLPVAHVPGLRPTPDSVRERLFNWLGQDLDGLHCLDLFAGTGVLGFEAASRGAACVTLVERDRRAFAQIEHAAQALGASQVRRVKADALEFAAAHAGPVDLLFLDPPYGRGLLQKVEPMLDRFMATHGLIYCEAEAPVPRLGRWTCCRSGQAGQVFYQLLECA